MSANPSASFEESIPSRVTGMNTTLIGNCGVLSFSLKYFRSEHACGS